MNTTGSLVPEVGTNTGSATGGVDTLPANASRPVVSPKVHLPVLDAMRGIAALSVCWFHYTNAQFTETFSAYRSTGTYGWLGVQIFFVISGFVIPWSLLRADYHVTSFFRFFAKRILRLDPPYLCSIAIVLAGYYVSSLSPGHTGGIYLIPWRQVLAHLGYMNAFLGMPWLQMSYWSLAIEFQYYVFIGLCFPLLASKERWRSLSIYGAFAALSILLGRNDALLPHHLPVFLLGITVFRFKCVGTSRTEVVIGLLFATALSVFVDGGLPALAGVMSCLTILLITGSAPILNFFGRISYSLYLIHVFVGQTIFGLVVKRGRDLSLLKWLVPWAAVASAIAAAYVLYRVVELPSKRWSSHIDYRDAS